MDISDALGLSEVQPSKTIPPLIPIKSEPVGEIKTKFLLEKGMEIVGKVLLKGDDVAIVTDQGRVNWFKSKDIFK